MADLNPTEIDLYPLAEAVGAALKARGQMLSTAESCTGGWVGETITAVPGSSHWYERGFITYTNESKQDMLGVAANTLSEFGAVSEQTVREMVAGALEHSRAQVAVAISGIAGPGGGTPFKPVGTICMGWGVGGQIETTTLHFTGDRREIRGQAVQAVLRGLLDRLGEMQG